jgi:SAM-dependent methyltransferase
MSWLAWPAAGPADSDPALCCNHSMSRDQSLRIAFNAAASLYQIARPDYPAELYGDLLAITGLRPPARLLEVGCGPGKATRPLAERGFRITAVELGRDLAAAARQNLAAFPDVRIVTSSFEEWTPDHPHSFELVYAATAWHWVDPQVRYANAAKALVPGGHLAVWGARHGFPADFDPFFTEIQQVYAEIGETYDGDWPPPPPEDMPDASSEFEASGHFTTVAVRRYVWAQRYAADDYISLLNTFSGHIAMEPAKREYLYKEIRRRLAGRPDGKLTRHWASVLTVGQRS